MSAIGAIFHRDGQAVDRRMLDRMRGGLKMYGPDRDGVDSDGCVGLAWTHGIGFTPQDRREFQPMAVGGGALLVFAGRLDHRAELAEALGLTAAKADAMADGALVRLAWDAWGERLVERLYGEYALIVADAAARRLVAIRGPLRSPPLFYAETGQRIALASMPKGLFALGDIPRDLDDTRFADWLALNFEDKEASYFRGLKSLPMGRILVATPDAVTVTRFYDLRDTPSLRLPRDDDYVAAANELLDAAVASAMRAVETPSLSLSSGLDSPTVAVAALDWLERHPGGRPLLGLTSVPEAEWDGRNRPGYAGDEGGPVRALAARYPQLEVRFLDAAGLPLDHGLEQRMAASDAPDAGVGNSHWGTALSEASRADGRKVMLNGGSGNATLSLSAALEVQATLFRQGRWLTLLRELRAYNRALGSRTRFGLRGLMANGVLPNLPDALYNAYQRMRGAPLDGWRGFSGMREEFAATSAVDARLQALGWDDNYRTLPNRRAILARMMDRGRRHESAVQGMGWLAVTGIQGRDPLGDRKLVEFCYAIPDDQFYARGVDRRLVKRMMATRLPREILTAPRGEQGADWFLRLQRDRTRYLEELEKVAADPLVADRIDVPRLRRLLETMPAQTPLTRADHPDAHLLMYGFGRAIAASRYLRMLAGRND